MPFRYEGTPISPGNFFGFCVSRGEINSVSEVKKFGRNDAAGTSFIPIAIGGDYKTPSAAVSLEFVSDSLADALDDTGMHELTIQGLDASWMVQEVSVAAHPTAGTTAVAIPGTWLRVFRAYVSKSGTYGTFTTGSHSGDITIRVAGGGDVWAQISNTDYPKGQTEIAGYTVPLGYTGYIKEIEISVDSTKAGDLILLQRPNANTVTSSYTGAMRAVAVYDGVSGALSIQNDYTLGPFVGPCDLGWLGKVGTGTGSISVNFTIILVKENNTTGG